ncbi:MAG: hypothetical protein ACXVDH_02600 [Nocardioides sp.]
MSSLGHTDHTPGAGSHIPSGLEGRATAPLLRVMLGLTAAAAAFIGLIAFVGGLMAGGRLTWFSWTIESPVTAALLGAGFIGAVPMLLHCVTRVLWEEIRVPVIAVASVLTLMTVVTIGDIGRTGITTGSIMDPAFLLGAAWLLGVGGLTLGTLAALCLQLFEPALPLGRLAALPRWTLPLIALEGTGLAGLGFGLLATPGFWAQQMPWPMNAIDARMIGAWCLALGVALLAALVEDDLVRVRGGLLGVTGIGTLALVALAVRHRQVDWSGWAAWSGLALIAGMTATGFVGGMLARRAVAVAKA